MVGLFLLISEPAVGGSGDEGKAAGVFLKIDPFSKSAALGSAFSARAKNSTAIHFNPAGLARMSHSDVQFTRMDMIANIDYNYLSFSMPVSRTWGGFGLSATSIDFGDLQRTTIDATLNPVRQGTFGADNIALTGSYGLPLTDSIELGLSGKFIQQNIAEFDAETGAVDAGIKIHSPLNGLAFGLSAQNLIGEVKFVEEEDPLPRTFRAGFNFSTPSRWGADRLQLAGDIVTSNDADVHLSGGLEYDLFHVVSLRVGYNGAPDVDDGITLGGGVHLSSFNLDFAFVPMGELGDNQRFTLGYRFGGAPDPPEPRKETRKEKQKAATPPLRDQSEHPSRQIRPPLNVKQRIPSEQSRKSRTPQSGEDFLEPEQLYEWKLALDLGKHAYLEGNFQKARNQFMKVLKIRPNFVTNLVWLGLTEFKLGMKDTAKQRLYRALELDPNNEIARKNLERISDT